MKTKKSSKADLEKKKIIFLEIGFVITLCVVLYSFEWGTSDTTKFTYVSQAVILSEDFTPITRPEPPKPEVKLLDVQPVAPEINIVEDDDPEDDINSFNNDNIDDPVNPTIYNFNNEDPPEVPETIPWGIVEVKPLFPGGDAALLKFIAENTLYPFEAKESGIEGTVYVSFVISNDGKVKSVTLARGVHGVLDKEALRVISLLPKWSPGKQLDIPVPVSYIIPIKFKLY